MRLSIGSSYYWAPSRRPCAVSRDHSLLPARSGINPCCQSTGLSDLGFGYSMARWLSRQKNGVPSGFKVPFLDICVHHSCGRCRLAAFGKRPSHPRSFHAWTAWYITSNVVPRTNYSYPFLPLRNSPQNERSLQGFKVSLQPSETGASLHRSRCVVSSCDRSRGSNLRCGPLFRMKIRAQDKQIHLEQKLWWTGRYLHLIRCESKIP